MKSIEDAARFILDAKATLDMASTGLSAGRLEDAANLLEEVASCATAAAGICNDLLDAGP